VNQTVLAIQQEIPGLFSSRQKDIPPFSETEIADNIQFYKGIINVNDKYIPSKKKKKTPAKESGTLGASPSHSQEEESHSFNEVNQSSEEVSAESPFAGGNEENDPEVAETGESGDGNGEQESMGTEQGEMGNYEEEEGDEVNTGENEGENNEGDNIGNGENVEEDGFPANEEMEFFSELVEEQPQ
jgi:hypothetical protein